MSDYRLNTNVHAVELDSDGKPTGRAQTFGPGDDLGAPGSEWALAAISNPDVWDGDVPPRSEAPAAIRPDDELARLRARVVELEAAGAPRSSSQTADTSTPAPARSGPGSGAERWRAYAADQGVDVADGASREDVIAALEAAGKPTK